VSLSPESRVSLNVVSPGPVGIIAAPGPGAQQLICLLDAAGVGISHWHGVEDQERSEALGRRSTWQAMTLLDADPATEVIVVVSRPPAAHLAEELAAFAANLSTPVRFALIGPGRDDLTTVAEGIVKALGRPWREPRSWPPSVRVEPPDPAIPGSGFQVLHGAFVTRALCYEAMVIAAAALGPIASNLPLDGAPRIEADLELPGPGHVIIDFGDPALSEAQPPTVAVIASSRADWILQQALAPHTGGTVLLLDVALGDEAPPDPAGELGPVIAAANVIALTLGPPLAVVVSLCGSRGDRQGVERQACALAQAGAAVHLSNAAAARAAARLIATR
jgi:FdrA protein